MKSIIRNIPILHRKNVFPLSVPIDFITVFSVGRSWILTSWSRYRADLFDSHHRSIIRPFK